MGASAPSRRPGLRFHTYGGKRSDGKMKTRVQQQQQRRRRRPAPRCARRPARGLLLPRCRSADRAVRPRPPRLAHGVFWFGQPRLYGSDPGVTLLDQTTASIPISLTSASAAGPGSKPRAAAAATSSSRPGQRPAYHHSSGLTRRQRRRRAVRDLGPGPAPASATSARGGGRGGDPCSKCTRSPSPSPQPPVRMAPVVSELGHNQITSGRPVPSHHSGRRPGRAGTRGFSHYLSSRAESRGPSRTRKLEKARARLRRRRQRRATADAGRRA